MNILGISAFFHDSAAALLVDGKVVAAAQEERFSRVKHDASFPEKSIAFCLAEAGLSASDLHHVVFYEKPAKKFERIMVTHARAFPRGLKSFTRAMGMWLSSRLWIKSTIANSVGCDDDIILFSEHHLSHAASVFFSSPFEDACVLTLDGVGEWTTTAIFDAERNESGARLHAVMEQQFPHSIGLLYSALTAFLGFRVNKGEYKVMGLAATGTPRFVEVFNTIAPFDDEGVLSLDLSYFSFHHDAEKSFSRKLHDLLGGSRQAEDTFDFERPDDQRFADIAASLQSHLERYVLTLAKVAKRKTGRRNLCLAGGVALNCVANGHLAKASGFEQIFVQPAAGDAGGALGAAQFVSHVLYGEASSRRCDVFLGEAFSQDHIHTFLNDCDVEHERFEEPALLDAALATRLARGEVGGVLRGRFEWGPRSLGARSIIASAEHSHMQARVNASVKFRESFRPFAPAALESDAEKYFEILDAERPLLPYMLSVVSAKAHTKDDLPAVVHQNQSARLQLVRSADPLFDILQALKALTGIGVVLNTSLNLKGEPPVATPAEAYGLFVRSGLDFLVLEDCLITRGVSGLEKRIRRCA